MERRRPAVTAKTELTEIGESGRSVLANLVQLYQYDFSELARDDPRHGNIGDDGLFHSVNLDRFFANDERYAFLVGVEGRPAGFVLVSRQPSLWDPSERIWWVNEFFVVRKHRRLGVGEHAATAVFDRFPGGWQVAQMDVNPGAQAFWRRVIGRYTGGRFEERWFDDARWLGPVQSFTTPGA